MEQTRREMRRLSATTQGLQTRGLKANRGKSGGASTDRALDRGGKGGDSPKFNSNRQKKTQALLRPPE